MSSVFSIRRPRVAARFLAHRRYMHSGVPLFQARQSDTSGTNVTTESLQEDEEVIFFSQDKDILPEVEIKPFRRTKAETLMRFNDRFVQPSIDWYRKVGKSHGENTDKDEFMHLLRNDISSLSLIHI